MSTNFREFSGSLRLNSLEDTAALGARIASALVQGDVVALRGDLGAGKTALARTILLALGATGHMPSPTFTLVQNYDTPRLRVYHYDLYRINDETELDELGFDDSLTEGATLIEWPERGGMRIPAEALSIRLTIVDGDARLAEIVGPLRWAPIFRDYPKDI